MYFIAYLIVSLFLLIVLSTGRYWPKVAAEHRRKPYSIILADKNAPNEEVWKQVCSLSYPLAMPSISIFSVFFFFFFFSGWLVIEEDYNLLFLPNMP